ncbi:sigma-E factor negative regulatory protein [Trinickia dinghuensis]|uniref:Anti-sigma factor n=1 Tax=Trinickia dinghuensis TaxID=2291023 RepID=A0A3D8JWU6_9BURK|nr:RseA family anti-sigma factor [Trinickia dinghuensis]RDU97096.1 anti-sigma factor [Trinickia dinghuensis]
MGSVSMQSQGSSRGERLSAFVDGEGLEAPGSFAESFGKVLAEFDHVDRTTWSAYHLIGDALRSDDLAAHPAKSQAFLAGFAARLEAEPHILAPARAASRHGASVLRRRVAPALAVAAAAAVLSWVVIPQWHGFASQGAVQTAATSGRSDGIQSVAMTNVPNGQDGNIIRDADLDQYLEAHQQFAQQSMMAGSMPLIRAAVQTSQGQ